MSLELFPTDISAGAQGGAEFSTEIVVFGSGIESRNQNWLRHRGAWDVALAARKPGRWQRAESFFRNHGGRARQFAFKDPVDCSVVAGEGSFIVIDGTHRQLAKRWTSGSLTYDHPVYIIPSTATVVLASGSLDRDTGIVTGGAATTWTTTVFYKPARFDTDKLNRRVAGRQPNGDLIVEWDSIPILELRLE